MAKERHVSNEELREIIESAEEHVLSTKEVAEQVRIGQKMTRIQLKELQKEGEIQGRRIGSGIFIWWSNTSTDRTPSQSTLEKTPSESEESEDSDRQRNLRIHEIGDEHEEVVAAIKELELPGTDVVLELRRLAVQSGYYYIRRSPGQSIDEIADYVLDENPAGFQYCRTEMQDMLLQSFRSLSLIRIENDGERVFEQREFS